MFLQTHVLSVLAALILVINLLGLSFTLKRNSRAHAHAEQADGKSKTPGHARELERAPH